MSERIISNNMTLKQLEDSVNNIIDNFKYKEINISDVISFNKYVNLYTYSEVTALITENKASWDDFQIVKIKGETFRVKKTDIHKK